MNKVIPLHTSISKKYFLLLLLPLFLSAGLFAQYGAQISLLAPTGYYKYVLKPSSGIEIFVKTGDDDDYYSFGGSLGYSSFKPTQDTFKTYAIGGLYNQLLPGYEVVHSYDEFSVGLTNDFRVLPDAKLCPMVGMDVYFYVISIAEDTYTETVQSYSTTGDNYWLLSLVPRVGLRYPLNKEWYISGFFGRSMSIAGSVPNQAIWKTSISLTYYPN